MHCGVTRNDRIRNKHVRGRKHIFVSPIKDKKKITEAHTLRSESALVRCIEGL